MFTVIVLPMYVLVIHYAVTCLLRDAAPYTHSIIIA